MAYTQHGHHNIWTTRDTEREPKARQCGGSTNVHCRDCEREMTLAKEALVRKLRDGLVKQGKPLNLARALARHAIDLVIRDGRVIES